MFTFTRLFYEACSGFFGPRAADTPSQFSSTIEGKHKITLELNEKEKYYFLVALRNSDNGEADNAARMLFKSLRDRELVINGEY
jgi:hypothetical protein